MRRALPPLAAVIAVSLLAACETTRPPPLIAPPPPPPPPPTPAEEFMWSTGRGANSLIGTLLYRPSSNEAWSCAGQPVALMPETSYSRGRMLTLYGSAERSLQSMAQVRARSAANPGPDYGQFVKSTTCDPQDNFTFTGLPDGPWFVIVPVRQTRPAGANGAMVVMQRVDLRGGGPARITLPQGVPVAAPAPAPAPAARPGPRPAPARR